MKRSAVLLALVLAAGAPARAEVVDGVAVIERVAALERGICSVAMTGDGTVERAVRAMRAGAMDFIKKPFDPALLSQTLERAAQSRQDRRGEAGTGLRLGEPPVHDRPIGSSASMQAVMQVVQRVADISGEYGRRPATPAEARRILGLAA